MNRLKPTILETLLSINLSLNKAESFKNTCCDFNLSLKLFK